MFPNDSDVAVGPTRRLAWKPKTWPLPKGRMSTPDYGNNNIQSPRLSKLGGRYHLSSKVSLFEETPPITLINYGLLLRGWHSAFSKSKSDLDGCPCSGRCTCLIRFHFRGKGRLYPKYTVYTNHHQCISNMSKRVLQTQTVFPIMRKCREEGETERFYP
jgi:hypothetical protein